MTEDIIHKPRSDEEMLHAVPGSRIAMYSDLCRAIKKVGIRRVLRNMVNKSKKWIILLQDPFDEKSGHWLGLNIFPELHKIYFFSSYGGKPDAEKIEWIPHLLLVMSEQEINALNDGLKQLFLEGWDVHYNEYPYQIPGDGTATCGIWTAGFLNSGMSPTQFLMYNKQWNISARQYFNAFFK